MMSRNVCEKSIWAAAVLLGSLGCDRKAETTNSVSTTSVSPRKLSAQQLESLASDPAYFGDAGGQVKAFIAQLNTDKPIPPTIIAAWYSRAKPEQPGLDLHFYDESQTIRGFRLKTGPASSTGVYDYVIYLPESRNNRALDNVSIQVISEPPPDLATRANVPVQKVPGSMIRAWVPEPTRNSPVTICLLDADGREHACTPLKERSSPNTRPASRAP